MEDTSRLRQAVLTWLEQACNLPAVPQTITDVALAALPEWEALSNAVVRAAPISDQRDLYGKVDGDWLPQWSTLLGGSGLGDATRLVAQGAKVPVEDVADSFVAFCTAPAPAVEDWLLLTGDLPEGTRIDLGRYTLQAFTTDELRQLGPMPALYGIKPGGLDLQLLAGAPFVHVPDPDRASDRSGGHWFDFTGPRPEARHWRALLPLILWSPELLHVDAVFDVERGRDFGLHQNHVPTTLQIYEDRYGRQEETEVRELGNFHVTRAEVPRLQAFCTAVTAKIDAVMDGAASRRKLPKKRARRLERAARHLLQAHQRTHSDYSVWEQEADELHLDYVIALEALMASPNDDHAEGISERIRSRASAFFPTPALRDRVENMVQKAYSARSKYVHGDALKDQDESERLTDLRNLRLLVRQIVLRWLVLTPYDLGDLASLLDAAADGTGREHAIDEPLRAFFSATPPQDRPQL
ncbi:HEPN domain-containing protein [Streptomyces justiciae]|uniref:HEPN domain-containing protein n=1 Tax=Streptomyces justiciae TaxID=2780140 RepID=A0ABU3M979_9ACTN|nr:HEPN domain-containing protein [Streptomyces justiciae]MDT7847387.1 HEPN domain-containing protein [Streptomyces justiciae]